MQAQKKPVVIDFIEINVNTTPEEIKSWVETFNQKFEDYFDDLDVIIILDIIRLISLISDKSFHQKDNS